MTSFHPIHQNKTRFMPFSFCLLVKLTKIMSQSSVKCVLKNIKKDLSVANLPNIEITEKVSILDGLEIYRH